MEGIIEIRNPVDGTSMKWVQNDFTNQHSVDIENNQRIQKALSLELVLEKGKGYLDIGANLGEFGIPMAHSLKNLDRTDITVYCVDPDPGKCNFMKNVVEINNLSNVLIINKGLTDISGKYSLNQEVVNACNTSTGGWQYMVDQNGIDFTTLDELWENKIIGPIGFFQLDAQWMESKILAGGEKYLAQFRPLIMMEYWPVTSRFSNGGVQSASPGHRNTRGQNPTLHDRSSSIENDPEFQKIFNKLNIIVSNRNFNTEKITRFGEHPWKEWDLLLEFKD